MWDGVWGVVLQCGHAWLGQEAGNTEHCPGAFGHLCSWVMGVTAVGEGGEQKRGWCSEESRARGGVRQTPAPPAIPSMPQRKGCTSKLLS